MSDIVSSRELLARYAIARIPFVLIQTIERSRTLDILKSISEELSLPFYVHTLSKGLHDLSTKKTIINDKSIYAAVDYMSEQMRNRQYLTLVLTEISDISSENHDARLLLDLIDLASESASALIILTNRPIWNQLQRQGMVVKLDLPNEMEMYHIVKNYLDDYRSEIPIDWDDKDVYEATTLLSGASQVEAENVIAALIANKRIRKSDMDEVRFAKDRLFSNIAGLEKITVDESMKQVGGLVGLQRWLNEKRVLFSAEKRLELKNMGLRPPRGILLAGIPGCGKSMMVKAISINWKLPLYRLDFSTVQDAWHEHQLKTALNTAENVAPCILWIDEIEKGLAVNGKTTDNGIMSRMLGQFLFWLQECKQQIFVVATANDVSNLPIELLRRGRFDELFFIDLPTPKERFEILTIYMRKYLRINFVGEFSEKVVKASEGFTGADIECTVRNLAYRVIANPSYRLTEDIILEAFHSVIPLSQTCPELIETLQTWGNTRAISASE